MLEKLKRTGKKIKQEIEVYKLVLQDKKTPILGKFFLGLAVGYFFLPFDLIPDFIPIIGHVDDVIIIPLLIIIALKFIPKEVVQKHRAKVQLNTSLNPH